MSPKMQPQKQFLEFPSRPYFESLDIIRIFACFMVIMIHVRGNYTYTADGILDFWAGIYITALRPCVPLFIMLSGALLLPIREPMGHFFKKRFSRVLIPFFIWSVIYALIPMPYSLLDYAPQYAFTPVTSDPYLTQSLYNMIMIPITFTGNTCHFWFLFVIIGLYLLMPVLSPWLKETSGKGLIFFISIWSFTLFSPYLKYWGINEFQGECAWNSFGMSYYFAGYIGYLLIAFALIRFNTFSTKKSMLIGSGLFLTGWLFTCLGFWETAYEKANNANLELFINNLTPNVALMTVGMFLFLQKISIPACLQQFVKHLAGLSFGIFLVHWAIAQWIAYGFDEWQKCSGVFVPAGLGMPFLAGIVFLISWGITELLARLPLKKYWIG